MIKSFESKALKALWNNNDASKLPAQQVSKIHFILDVLDMIKVLPDDLLPYPQWRPHPLKGSLKGCWSVSVTGNYRFVFLFERGMCMMLTM